MIKPTNLMRLVNHVAVIYHDMSYTLCRITTNKKIPNRNLSTISTPQFFDKRSLTPPPEEAPTMRDKLEEILWTESFKHGCLQLRYIVRNQKMHERIVSRIQGNIHRNQLVQQHQRVDHYNNSSEGKHDTGERKAAKKRKEEKDTDINLRKQYMQSYFDVITPTDLAVGNIGIQRIKNVLSKRATQSIKYLSTRLESLATPLLMIPVPHLQHIK